MNEHFVGKKSKVDLHKMNPYTCMYNILSTDYSYYIFVHHVLQYICVH